MASARRRSGDACVPLELILLEFQPLDNVQQRATTIDPVHEAVEQQIELVVVQKFSISALIIGTVGRESPSLGASQGSALQHEVGSFPLRFRRPIADHRWGKRRLPLLAPIGHGASQFLLQGFHLARRQSESFPPRRATSRPVR